MYQSLGQLEQRDPLFGLTHRQMSNNGMLHGGSPKTTDFADEALRCSYPEGTVEVNPDEIECAIAAYVANDLERNGIGLMLDPFRVIELIKDAYETVADDTNYGFPKFTANYFDHLSRALHITESQRGRLVATFTEFLADLDDPALCSPPLPA